jgi:hypothetical protein
MKRIVVTGGSGTAVLPAVGGVLATAARRCMSNCPGNACGRPARAGTYTLPPRQH